MNVSFSAGEFESDLYRGVAACNKFMAEQHGSESFYAMALEIDTYYSNCFVYYNTESLHQKTVQKYMDGEYGESYRNEKTSRWELRWNPGDWPYSSAWPQPDALPALMKMDKWSENARDQMDNKELTSDDWQAYGVRLMTSACRALQNLQNSGVIELLPRTGEFRSFICDHDEPLIYGYLRYGRFVADGSVIMMGDLDDEVETNAVLEAFHG